MRVRRAALPAQRSLESGWYWWTEWSTLWTLVSIENCEKFGQKELK